MGTEKRERQKAGRAARVEAAEAAQRKAESRRRIAWIVGTVAFVAVVLLIVSLVRGNDKKKTDTASSSSSSVSTTTSAAALPSAAGQPCVALADPLPAGAPDVPVVPGPPPTELQTTDLVEGTGDPVPAGATVTVDYIGVSCSTGKIFDSSYTRGQPATFPLDQVIPGWTQGIPGMKVGGQRLLVIPPDQGYGDTGAGTNIAPGQTLWFVVDMKSFQPAGASGASSATP
jgi:peptidylprolyl isomerase